MIISHQYLYTTTSILYIQYNNNKKIFNIIYATRVQ